VEAFMRSRTIRSVLVPSWLAVTVLLWSGGAAAQYHPQVPAEASLDQPAAPAPEEPPWAEAARLDESARAGATNEGETTASGASATTAESFLTRSHVRSALVEIRTAWYRGVGFLVGDRRTVVTLGRLRDRYRRISVKCLGSEGPEVTAASTEVLEHGESTFVVLHLAAELPGEPLQVSADVPRVGESVFVILRRGVDRRDQVVPDTIEAAEAAVTAASTTTMSVGVARSQVWSGSPLFDGAGRLVGFFGDEGYAVGARAITGGGSLTSGRALLSPIVGIRVGTEFGGELIDPFDVEVELGLALWDQLGILVRLGAGIGQDVLAPYVRTDEVIANAMADERTLNLALELEYRLLITRAAMPLYFDFVVGLQYTMTRLDFHDIAIARDAGCDPEVMDCDQDVGFASGQRSFHGVGAAFGFDIRAGLFTMGYRLVHEALSYRLQTVHRLTFGITFR
jgi:hypothetical protein